MPSTPHQHRPYPHHPGTLALVPPSGCSSACGYSRRHEHSAAMEDDEREWARCALEAACGLVGYIATRAWPVVDDAVCGRLAIPLTAHCIAMPRRAVHRLCPPRWGRCCAVLQRRSGIVGDWGPTKHWWVISRIVSHSSSYLLSRRFRTPNGAPNPNPHQALRRTLSASVGCSKGYSSVQTYSPSTTYCTTPTSTTSYLGSFIMRSLLLRRRETRGCCNRWRDRERVVGETERERVNC